jgi:hypothetical protein
MYVCTFFVCLCVCIYVFPHRRYLHFEVVVRLAWSNDPESYTGGSIATGRVSQAGQVKGDDPDKERYPGPPDWGLSVGLTALPRKKKQFVTDTLPQPRKFFWRHVVKKAEALHGL